MKKLLCVIFALALVTATLTPVALVSAADVEAASVSLSTKNNVTSVKVGEKVICYGKLDSELSGKIKVVRVEVTSDSKYLANTSSDTKNKMTAIGYDDEEEAVDYKITEFDTSTQKGARTWTQNVNIGTGNIVQFELEGVSATTSTTITVKIAFKTIEGIVEYDYAAGEASINLEVKPSTCPHTNTETKYSETEHWTYCKDCQQEVTGTREAHKGGSATCQAKAECSVCGQKYGNLANCDYSAETVDAKYLKTDKTCTSYAVYYKSCKWCGEASSTDTFEDTAGKYGEHVYEKAWTTDGTNHWHKCTNPECTSTSGDGAHTYDNKTDGTYHWKECSTCHKEIDKSTHSYGGWVSTDATKHWKECGCGVKALEADHVYDNDCDTDCNVCGHTRTITHKYDETTWKTNATQHWHECTVCHDKKDIENHGWSEVVLQDGSNLKQKADCTNAAQYWKVCEECGKISTTEFFSSGQPADHNYASKVKSGDYLKDAKTCTSYATYYYKCTGCAACSDTLYWADEEGGYAQHDFSNEVVAEKYLISPADCQHYAKYYKSCTACGEASNTDTFNYEEGGYGNHNFDTLNWESDGTNHWHKCLVDGCTEKNSEAACSYSKQYSEGGTQHWDECATCKNKKNYENHEYGNWVTSDADKHWKECGCGVKTLEADHVYDNDCDDTCNVCGHTRQITHSYDMTTWKSDATNHWHECTCCKDKTDTDTHSYDNLKLEGGANLKSPATCTAYAVYYKVCSVCHKIDYNNTFDDVTGGYAKHVFEETWTNSGTYHWHKCTNPQCTETSNYGACTYSEKYNDTQHWEECDTCHTKKLIENHSYGNWVTTDDTKHWKECGCGVKSLEGNHDYDNDCDTTCNTCGHIRQITHDYDTTTWKTDDNQHWHECKVCHVKTDIGDHSMSEIADAKYLKTAATCKAAAVYYKSCSTCGKMGTDTFTYGQPLDHTYDKENWKYDENNHWHECTSCQEARVDEAPHAYGDIILPDLSNLKTPATETTPAVYYKACECGVFDKTQTFTGKDYNVTEGANAKWEGSGSLTFKSNAEFSKFVAVLVDNEIVDASNYTVTEGSTVVTLSEAYLKTLSLGEHTVTIVSSDGYAAANFTATENPGGGNTPGTGGTTGGTTQKTGDNSSALLWIMITVLSGIAMTVVFVAPRKKER